MNKWEKFGQIAVFQTSKCSLSDKPTQMKGKLHGPHSDYTPPEHIFQQAVTKPDKLKIL